MFWCKINQNNDIAIILQFHKLFCILSGLKQEDKVGNFLFVEILEAKGFHIFILTEGSLPKEKPCQI